MELVTNSYRDANQVGTASPLAHEKSHSNSYAMPVCSFIQLLVIKTQFISQVEPYVVTSGNTQSWWQGFDLAGIAYRLSIHEFKLKHAQLSL